MPSYVYFERTASHRQRLRVSVPDDMPDAEALKHAEALVRAGYALGHQMPWEEIPESRKTSHPQLASAPEIPTL